LSIKLKTILKGYKMTQQEQILGHMQTRGEIDPMVALNEYGCFRLAARIADLKKLGHKIDTQMQGSRLGKRYATYSLAND